MAEYKTIPTLLSVKEFSNKHTTFSQGALRNYIFNETFNHMKDFNVIKRVKSRIYIDEQAFFNWIEYQTQLANR